jgi:hypothetical protein
VDIISLPAPPLILFIVCIAPHICPDVLHTNIINKKEIILLIFNTIGDNAQWRKAKGPGRK